MKKFFVVLILLIAMYNTVQAQIVGIKIDGDTCTSQSLNLQALGTSSSPYFFWNFGDPASGANDTITITGLSASPFPTHIFSGPGMYTVCVSFQEPGSPVSTICRTISVGLCCNGVILSADSCLQNAIPFFLNTSDTINSITWNFGDPASGINNISNVISPTHTFSSTGAFMVTATINATCGNYTDTFYATIINCLPPSSCTGVILNADSCFNNLSNFQIASIYPINAVQWNFGDPASGINNGSSSPSPTHTFSSIGSFTVSAIANFSCGIDTIEKVISIFSCNTDIGSSCTLYIPNAFSPNNDNTNDFFFPIKNAACSLTEYTIFIYNRWGERIYESDNISNKWNGQYRNQDCPTGVYYYFLSYKFNNQIKQTRKGDITILR